MLMANQLIGFAAGGGGSITIQGTATTAAALSSGFSLNLPSSISAGQILIMLLARAGGAQTFSWPAGWTELTSTSDGSTTQVACAWATATGTEGSTITVSSSDAGSESTRAIAYRISGGISVQAGTPATGSSSNPNPPSLSPSWGAADALWLAMWAGDTGTATSSNPTNYALGAVSIDGGADTSIGAAARSLGTSSEDPGTFTLASSSAWVANTIAIRPIS